MRNFIKISGFVLVFVATVGLLLSEFVWAHSSSRTSIFWWVNLLWLVYLALAQWGLKSKG